MAVPLLSAFYFGSVEHYRLLARHERVVIDTGEHYERQSYRTRTSIVGANGRHDLTVQIERRSGEKMPMRTAGLSYVETWPQQHLHAIRSAYGQTPWAIHYLDEIEAVVLPHYDRLIDLDLATMRLGLKWLGLRTVVEVSEAYVERSAAADLLDLRNTFHPKKALPEGVISVQPYPQVFSDRHGPLARMSVIDLVCNCGPEALRYLNA
ncbi:MAG TPA: WbqC family protein [Flavobacteriales bacterium]|jgi:hypothetical protein|nr:WbqC family protein [Flavobacteriales bacterium]